MASAAHIRPFGFDQVFGAPPRTADAAEETDPWIRIEALRAELVALRQQGADQLAAARSEAFLAGQAQARDEQGAALLAAADAIHGAIEDVEGALEAITDRTVRDAAEVACAAAEMLAGQALAAAPAAAIDAAIGRALRQVARGQEIQITVHPDLLGAVEAITTARQAADRRRLSLSVAADPAIAPGDAHIHWDQGGIVLDAATRAQAITVALAGVLPAA